MRSVEKSLWERLWTCRMVGYSWHEANLWFVNPCNCFMFLMSCTDWVMLSLQLGNIHSTSTVHGNWPLLQYYKACCQMVYALTRDTHFTKAFVTFKISYGIRYTHECNVIYAIKQYWVSCTELYKTVFLNCRAAARYRTLTSIIPGREKLSWNLSFYFSKHFSWINVL